MLIQIPRTHFILLVILLVSHSLIGQTINFNHITVENGLSNNDVNTLIQDKYGFIWFGTDDGLNRYDGYNFKVFRHAPDDSNSISDNSIWALEEDKKGNIWIGTKAGNLNKYDPFLEIFTHWKIESDFTEENSVKSICEDKNGNIWVGTYKDGLYKFDELTNKFAHWSASNNDPKSLSHNYIQSIAEDSEGNLIIGTYIGLNIFNPALPEDGFKRFYHNPDNDNTISNNLIWGLTNSENDSAMIWIGTANDISIYRSDSSNFDKIKISNPNKLQYGTSSSSIIEDFDEDEKNIWVASYSGLIRINLFSGKSSRFLHDESNSKSLISNQINSLIMDRTGVLWIATENGISYSTPKSKMFNSVGNDKSKFNVPVELQKSNITAISKLNDENILIGTSEGLYFLTDVNSNTKLNPIQKFNDFHIWSLASSKGNGIWVGTYGKGLKKYNFEKNDITSWDVDHPKARTNSIYYAKTITADSKNNVWVGYWGVGTARINVKTGDSEIWLYEKGNPKSISHNDVWVIKEDRYGRIWLGTVGGGINLFEDKDGGIFNHWLKNGAEYNNLSSNNIYSICESKNASHSNKHETILWLGTSNGLNKFIVSNDKDSQDIYNIDVKIESYTVKDGLPDNSVNSILEDRDGNLWLGTGSGISFFNVEKKTFNNFASADGINGTLMNYESALMLKNGLALFGSTKGLNVFDPKKIKQSILKPNIVITDFQIFNKTVKIGKDSPLKESLSSAKEIILTYDQNVFSIEFAALDYNSSKSIQYAYKMEGFDNEWIKSETRRFVTYTNLNAGTYIFKVKATNADGIWSEDYKALRIIMGQPWWKSPWAYLIYGVFIIIGLLGIRRFEQNRTKLRTELKLREIEASKNSELEKLKSRFFANLSHEFRTPLMLIKGPLEQLKLNGKNEKYSENIELIERNSNHLKVLIDQLLELSQLEKAVILVKAKRMNIIPILKGLFSSYISIAEEKNIKLLFESDTDSIISWIDNDKLEKVINNLLSNAIKFTESDGLIKIIIKEEENKGKPYAKIKISDNGISIPEEKLDRIFDRFYQVDDSTQRSYGGSGIGLALVKEFVELHNWEISVKSEMGKGTEFTLNIPLWDEYLDENQKIEAEEPKNKELSIMHYSNSDEIKSNSEDKEINKLEGNQTENVKNIISNNKPSVLIVDDSKDVRKYISNLLVNDYSIFEAEDGIKGIETAKEIMPDLIISDVMMPLMDGLEFCRIIKSEWQTSDIPVILLTAKASFDNKIEGLEIGADEYLTKPFESLELFTRIKNLLEQRKRLVNKYINHLDFGIKTKELTTADDDFITKARELVENNLDKTNFSTEQLAKELFVSRTKLHRKMLEITGQAPGEFVRIIKLSHAAKLITEKRLSITQIAFEIGFSSPAQFTRAFSKQFHCLPSEYLSNQK
jgi:signal transduction histidine kinase/ligand-binding sensor domain-containing protein/DNA-binding response OmpR family regulator